MSELFPGIPTALNAAGGAAGRLPMLREVKWDFAKGTAVFCRGSPVTVEGPEAVKVWAWHALQAERYRYEHESWRYGTELDRLRGRAYQRGTMEAEARRYIQEALLACPYITHVEVPEIEQVGDVLRFTVRYSDIYGGGDVIHV